jgi:Ca2+-transporting ATPase
VLRNRWLLGGLSLSIALQALVLYWAPLGAMFHTVPLSAASLSSMALLASTVLWAEEGRKLLARRLGSTTPAAQLVNT